MYQPEMCKVDPKVTDMSLIFCFTLKVNFLSPFLKGKKQKQLLFERNNYPL